MKLIELMALSSTVLLALTDEGWRLSDGHRFTKPYPSWDEAMDDRETQRALTFGTALPERGKD